MSLFLLPIAGAASVLTYAAAFHVLKNISAFRSPRIMALCTALLSGLGLLSLGNVVVTLILIPFATLGMALLIFALFRWLVRNGAMHDLQRFLDDNTASPPRRPPASTPPPASGAKKCAPAHLRETPQPNE